jgi:small subunit ribosomal protein S16
MLIIRLRRAGKKKKPFYHIVVTEHTAPVQGKFVEKLGYYDPTKKSDKDQLLVKKDRIEYWISKGAKTSDTVNNLLVRAEVLPAKDLMKMSSTKKKKEKEEPKPEKPEYIETASKQEDQGESILEETVEESKSDETPVEPSSIEATEDKPAKKPSEDSKSEEKPEEKPAE